MVSLECYLGCLVQGFESHEGLTFGFICKNNYQSNQLPRALTGVGKNISLFFLRVDEGRKRRIPLAIKAKASIVVRRGEETLRSDAWG